MVRSPVRTRSRGSATLPLVAFVALMSVGPPVLAEATPRASIEWSGSFPRDISGFNLFADPVAQIPNAGLYPFDINTPLFSDYAVKDRFIFLPEGAAMTYREDGPFDLPVGAALVKSFSFLRDFRDPSLGRRLIETRLLIREWILSLSDPPMI